MENKTYYIINDSNNNPYLYVDIENRYNTFISDIDQEKILNISCSNMLGEISLTKEQTRELYNLLQQLLPKWI